jgi:SAM-dependent methyltransferase
MDDPYAAIVPFYDRATEGANADLALYEALARRQAGPILEVGAGTGRIAVPLAAAGFDVVALDRSAAMIEHGRRRAASAGIEVEWRVGSIERLRLAPRFALVICALDTFLHLTDSEQQRAALRAIRRCLRADGLAVFDLPTLGSWSDWQPGVRPLDLLWSDRDGVTGVVTNHFSTFRADPSQQCRSVTHIFEQITSDGAVRRWQASYALRFVGRFEFAMLLERSGLRLCSIHGDYELGPMDEDSGRMIVLADRRGRTR